MLSALAKQILVGVRLEKRFSGGISANEISL